MMQCISNHMPTCMVGITMEVGGQRKERITQGSQSWAGPQMMSRNWRGGREGKILPIPGTVNTGLDSDGVLWPPPPLTSDPCHPSDLSSSSWCKVKAGRDSNSFQIMFPVLSSAPPSLTSWAFTSQLETQPQYRSQYSWFKEKSGLLGQS